MISCSRWNNKTYQTMNQKTTIVTSPMEINLQTNLYYPITRHIGDGMVTYQQKSKQYINIERQKHTNTSISKRAFASIFIHSKLCWDQLLWTEWPLGLCIHELASCTTHPHPHNQTSCVFQQLSKKTQPTNENLRNISLFCIFICISTPGLLEFIYSRKWCYDSDV